jgi:hypothetical protein
MIQVGDKVIRNVPGIVVEITGIQGDEVSYRVIVHTSKRNGYLGTASLSKILPAIENGRFRIDETQRVINLLNEYE